MRKIRIGVVGAGFISGTYHCPALARLKERRWPGLELSVICDLDRERTQKLAGQFGFGRVCTDAGRMAEDGELDAVLVLVSPPAMKQTALAFIRRGIPCLLEKPPGATSEEVRELIDAESESSAACLVALNRRFMPLALRLREVIESAPSPAQLLHAEMCRFGRTEEEFAFGTGVHSIDLMRFLAGDVRSLRVEKLMLEGNTAPAYQAGFTFSGGMLGRLAILPESGIASERYTVHGNGWTARLDSSIDWTVDYPGRLCYWEGRKKHWVQDMSVWPETMRDRLELTGFLGEAEAFLEGVTEDRPMRPSLSDCLQSIEIGEALLAGRDKNFG